MIERVLIALIAFCCLACGDSVEPVPDETIINEVVFAGDSGNAIHLFRVNTDGSSIRQLTHGPTRDFAPRVSPDGRTIAFVRTTGTTNQIWTVDATGTLARQLTFDTTRNATDPAWSPTGSQIVFEAQETTYRHRDIFILDVATGAVSNISANLSTATRRFFYSPDWSVNNEIVFSKSDTLYWITPSGNVVRKRHYADLIPDQFRWSANGSKIAFTYIPVYSDPPEVDIAVIDANGENFRSLTSHPDIDADPDWNPAGTEIVFRSHRDGEPELYIMPLNFGEDLARRLTHRGGTEWTPSWK